MIFVTVGTHEQQFNRLIQEIDNLKRDEIITEDVFIQTGYSTYEPKYCEWKKLLAYNEMMTMYEKANIIITHGGPASFMKALEFKKIPIVVPRQEKYGEHINNHQVEFVNLVRKQFNNILEIENIDDLSQTIINYKSLVNDKKDKNIIHNNDFNIQLDTLIKEMF